MTVKLHLASVHVYEVKWDVIRHRHNFEKPWDTVDTMRYEKAREMETPWDMTRNITRHHDTSRDFIRCHETYWKMCWGTKCEIIANQELQGQTNLKIKELVNHVTTDNTLIEILKQLPKLHKFPEIIISWAYILVPRMLLVSERLHCNSLQLQRNRRRCITTHQLTTHTCLYKYYLVVWNHIHTNNRS